MPETDIRSTVKSDLTNTMVDFSVPSETTDAAQGDVEFRWTTDKWNENLGFYKDIPELQTAIDVKANWTIGAGFTADEQTTLILGAIKGNGKDSFNSIIDNMIRVKTIDGDSFAEIIRDADGVLANLKPLAPDSIVTIQNGKGRIIRYEQVNKITKKSIKKFKIDEIFHLSRNRIADEIHGISVIRSVKFIIEARNEAMQDWKKVLHRNVFPIKVFELDTDDTTKIAEFKATTDAAHRDGENMYIPKGTVKVEQFGTAPNASLNPLTWIQQLNNYFFQAVNAPQIIVGNSQEFTDASGKIVYLAYEQNVKKEQLYVEEQVLGQLDLEIELTFPASLQTDAISDTPSEVDNVEEEPIEEAAQPNDTTEELEGET